MAYTERYANFDLTTGSDDGTSEANAWKTPASFAAGVAPGDRVNIKQQSVAHDLTTDTTWSFSGTATAPIWLRGYTSTITDGGMWEVAYNSSGTVGLNITGDYVIVEGIHFYKGATGGANNQFTLTGSNSWLFRCKIIPQRHATMTITNAYRSWLEIPSGYDGSWAIGKTNDESGRAIRTVFMTKNTSIYLERFVLFDGFDIRGEFQDNVFVGPGAGGHPNGIRALLLDRCDTGRGVSVRGNTFYNWQSGIHIDEEPDTKQRIVFLESNIMDTMVAYGVERQNTELGFVKLAENYHRACGTAFTNYSEEAEIVPAVELTASPFVNAGADDFNINETAGGGAVLRARLLSMDPTTTHAMKQYAFGAMFEPSAGGSGGLLLHPGMNGGING